MKLITNDQAKHMRNNGCWNRDRRRQERPADDFMPVVKLFCPWSRATWLLSEVDPHNHDVAYGLCDLGLGLPELGRVRLSSIAAIRSSHGVRVERDRYFRAKMTLSGYAEKARRCGRVVA